MGTARSDDGTGRWRRSAPISLAEHMLRLPANLSAALLAASLMAQDEPRFSSLPIPGIDGALVRSVAQDRFGALWLGTERGLHRFDGARTEHYLNDPFDSLSLSDDLVTKLHAGPDGGIWAATFAGAWRIDPFTGERRRVPLVKREGGTVPYECLDLAWGPDGSLWAFCNRTGLARMKAGEDRFIALDLAGVDMVRGGWVAPDGVVWFTNRDRLVRYHPGTGIVRSDRFTWRGQDAPPKTLLLGVRPDEFDPEALWCTSWGLGLVRFNTATGTFDRCIVRRKPMTDLRNIVLSAVQRDATTWWMQLDDTLVVADARTGDVHPLPLESPPRAVSSIQALADGAVVLGATGGAMILTPTEVRLTSVTNGAPFKNTRIAPCIDGSGYWIVRFYADRELIRVDGEGHVVERVPLPAFERPYEPFRILQASDGSVWLGTTYGLLRHAPGTSTLERVTLEPAGVPSAHPYVADLLEGPGGMLWLALHHLGVVQWDIARSTGRHYPAPTSGAGDNPAVVGLARFDGQRLLASLGVGGPALLDMSTGAFEPLSGPALPVEEFRAASDVLADGRGRVLVLTRSHGLLRLERSADGLWRLQRRWLPPDRPFFETAEVDAQGRAWLLTDQGLYVLDPADDILQRLDALHGFSAGHADGLALGRDGEVLVHAASWSRVGPGFHPSVAEPRLLLRSAVAGGRALPIRELLGGGLELRPASNDLHLAFGTVALLEGDAFTYRYRIIRDGEPGEWSDLGRERSFSLLDLRPGAYELELRAESPSARPAALSLVFTVLPPWWATWWARSGFAILAVLLVVLVTRKVLNRRYRAHVEELERERALEKVRMRIARDIHDGIGSGLTKITMLSRQMDAAAAPQAARIAEASAELVSELGEIVWTVDPRNDSFASFIAYVRSVLGRQFEDLPVELIADLRCAEADRERAIGPEHKRNILLVLKEAVSNALRHSGAARIEVRLDLHADGAELVVRDNGHGFDPQRIREGANGLANFSKRAEALGGTVRVDTGPKGTTVTLRVPLPSTNM